MTLITILLDNIMETKKLTAEDINKMTEKMKNSKNPWMIRIARAIETKYNLNNKEEE